MRKLSGATLICLLLIFQAAAPECFASSLVDRAELAQDRGNYDEAIDLYRQSIASEISTAGPVSERLSHLLCKLHRYAEAVQIVQQLVAATNNRGYKKLLARIYSDSGNFYQAQGIYQELLANDEHNGSLLMSLGECLEATGNFEAARDVYVKAGAIQGFEYASLGKLAKIKNAKSGNANTDVAIDRDTVFGVWPPEKAQSIKVVILNGTDVPGYRSSYIEFVRIAVDSWNAALIGLVHLEIVQEDPNQADIVVIWVDRIPGALGVTIPSYSAPKILDRCQIGLATNVNCSGAKMPAESPATQALWESHSRMMQEVTLHEFGHALGLEHSGNPTDIMFSGIYAMNSQDVPESRKLQNGDVMRCRGLYANSGTAVAANTGQVSPANVAPGEIDRRKGAVGVNAKNELSFESSIKASKQLQAMREALFKLNCGSYADCVEQLKQMLVENPKNAQAHYLLAVAFVALRRYQDATKQYEAVLKIEPTGELSKLATTGLGKIKN